MSSIFHPDIERSNKVGNLTGVTGWTLGFAFGMGLLLGISLMLIIMRAMYRSQSGIRGHASWLYRGLLITGGLVLIVPIVRLTGGESRSILNCWLIFNDVRAGIAFLGAIIILFSIVLIMHADSTIQLPRPNKVAFLQRNREKQILSP